MISCELHDYIEIACLYRMQVKLKLKNGQLYEGEATDIQLNGDGHECLLLTDQASGGQLTELKQMRASHENPHFVIVNF